MAAIDYLYRYARPFSLETSVTGASLRLAAELNGELDTGYFDGDLLDPLTTARSTNFQDTRSSEAGLSPDSEKSFALEEPPA